MHPEIHLDLHDHRARSLHRDARQQRLRAASRGHPSRGAQLQGWREALGIRLVRTGLRVAGGGELPLDRLGRLPQAR